MAYYDNPGQVNDEAISVAGGKTFQVIQVADSSGNIIDPAGGQIVIEGDVIVTEVEISNDVGNPIPVVADELPLPDGAATEDTIASLLTELEGKADLTETQPVELPYFVSTENSKTTGGLTPNENWNASGTGDEILPYGTVTVCVSSDQNSATSGLVFEASLDGVNWQTIEAYTYKTTEGLESFSMAPSGRYFRVRFVNGTVASTVTRIQTIYRQGYTKSSSHRIGDIISAEKDAELVKAVLAAEKPNLDFVDIRATAGGNLKISLEEINGVDPIPTAVPARTPTTTSIASSATSVTIRGANANRKGISVHNLSTATLYLSFTTPATTTNSFIAMTPGSFLLLDQQLIVANAIYGIWSAANGTAQVTEYV